MPLIRNASSAGDPNDPTARGTSRKVRDITL
jgi:hypothetical protein